MWTWWTLLRIEFSGCSYEYCSDPSGSTKIRENFCLSERLLIRFLYSFSWLHTTLHTTHYTAHYTLHCTLHTTHYTAHYTLHTSHYTAHYTLHCTLHTTHYTAHYTLHCTLHTTHYTAHYTSHNFTDWFIYVWPRFPSTFIFMTSFGRILCHYHSWSLENPSIVLIITRRSHLNGVQDLLSMNSVFCAERFVCCWTVTLSPQPGFNGKIKFLYTTQ